MYDLKFKRTVVGWYNVYWRKSEDRNRLDEYEDTYFNMSPEAVQFFLNDKEIFGLMFRRDVPEEELQKLKELGQELKKAPTDKQ